MSTTPQPVGGKSIGQYLIRRLQDHGIADIFGIPGDYVLSFYADLEKSDLNVVGCTREDCAGFAADAYARLNGMGALCVTYCVGGLSVCNSVAGAYAEKSPVVVISGSPGLSERTNKPLLHHMVRDFRTQYDVFEKLCVAGTELKDPLTAFSEIDRVLDACKRFKRPVYIDIPRDMVDVVPQIGHAYHEPEVRVDRAALAEAAAETRALLNASSKPIVLAGIEIHRFGLQDDVLALAEAAQLPIAATMLGKSVIRETHPLYVGLYSGGMSTESVRQFVEDSDCVLMLGSFMTDINLGIFTANLDPGKCIYATSEKLRIRHHHFHDVPLQEYISELTKHAPRVTTRSIPADLAFQEPQYSADAEAPLTVSRLFARLNEQLTEDTIVIADIGDALFGATELTIRGRTEFLSPAYYTSMGFSLPAALGAQVARPDARLVVVCGDGAFQMTGQELSTLVRHGFDPVVIILDNGGYGTERKLHAGEWEFNNIHSWNYHRLPDIYGGGTGHKVHTEGEFDAALQQAWDDRGAPSIIQACISQQDHSRTLHRLAERMSHTV